MRKRTRKTLNRFVNIDLPVLLTFLFIGLCLSIAAFQYVAKVDGELQEEQKEQKEQKEHGDNQREPKGRYDNFGRRADNQSETVKASNLNVELVAEGLEFPTTMAFLGPDDILVLEKDNGTVRRIINGSLLEKPLFIVNVNTEKELCMCGIATSKTVSGQSYVFLYFTEIQTKREKNLEDKESNPLANRLYRYELIDGDLQNPKLLLDLPKTAGPHHSGGAVMVGPDGHIYLPVGDFDNIRNKQYIETKAQNIKNSKDPDGRGGILHVTQDGNAVGNGILGDSDPLDKYYAYGIRNSYGIDFDPVTGYLWDTENGHAFGDEINLVLPGFNSGWNKVQGIWTETKQHTKAKKTEIDQLVDFNGKGTYSPPEFTWNKTVGPTALIFLDTDKLGQEYKNDLFVGDVNNGNIYHFDLNKDRTELVLTGKLSDKVANSSEEIDESDIVFGQGFGGITDIEVGSYDGNLYVVSSKEGKILRIGP